MLDPIPPAALDQIRANLAAIDVAEFHARRAEIEKRREEIDDTEKTVRARADDLRADALEVQRIGAERFDDQRVGNTFTAMLGWSKDRSTGGAEILLEYEKLQRALRGAPEARAREDSAEQRIVEDARAEVAAAMEPLHFIIAERVAALKAELASTYALALAFSGLAMIRTDEELRDAAAACRPSVGREIAVDPEFLSAVVGAREILTIARRQVHEKMPTPVTSPELSPGLYSRAA